MPATISTDLLRQRRRSSRRRSANQGLLLLAAVVTIYIVLGMLYESFIHPLHHPDRPARGGRRRASWRCALFGLDLSVIAVIGLLMLIGIVKKNAIMMIDVALTLQREGRRRARRSTRPACCASARS